MNGDKCPICGQPVVSVCNDLDLGGNGVTCHYEPATEDEKAKRIAALEAENAALRQDAAVGRAMIKGARFGSVAVASIHSSLWIVKYREASDPPVYREAQGVSPKAALAAAGLVEE